MSEHDMVSLRSGLGPLVPAVPAQLLQDTLRQHSLRSGGGTAWSVRLLMGGAAWLGGLFLLVFVWTLDLLDGPQAQGVCAAALLTAGIALRRLTRQRYSDFLVQLALTWVSAGVGLTLFVVEDQWSGVPAVLTGLIAVQLLLLALFPDSAQRFISTAVAAIAALSLAHHQGLPYAVEMGVVAMAAGAAWLWQHEARLQLGPLAPWQLPVSYGLSVGLFVPLVSTLTPHAELPRPGPLATVGLGVVLAWVLWRVLNELKPARRAEVQWMGGLGLLALVMLTLSAPGVLAALLGVVLGWHRRHPVLVGLSCVFLLAFGVAFYFHLGVVFAAKSAALVGSGALLLGLRGLLLARVRA